MALHREKLESLFARLDPEQLRRFRCTFDQRGRSVLLRRGSMQLVVRSLPNGDFEVQYERVAHECVRERCDMEQAVPLLDALLARKQLGKVDLG
jgi:hypothetical protein